MSIVGALLMIGLVLIFSAFRFTFFTDENWWIWILVIGILVFVSGAVYEKYPETVEWVIEYLWHLLRQVF